MAVLAHVAHKRDTLESAVFHQVFQSRAVGGGDVVERRVVPGFFRRFDDGLIGLPCPPFVDPTPRRIVAYATAPVRNQLTTNQTVQVERRDATVLGSSLILPGETDPLHDPDDILERLARRLDAVVDAGGQGMQSTTVVDLTGDEPLVTRLGCGPVEGRIAVGLDED